MQREREKARPRKSLVDHGDEQASPPQATEHVVSTSKMPASTSASLQPETSTPCGHERGARAQYFVCL